MAQYHKKNHPNRPQPRKEKHSPISAKPCVVRYLPANALMNYKPETGQLYLDGFGTHYVFPSKAEAHTAVWHASQTEPGNYRDYRVEEV